MRVTAALARTAGSSLDMTEIDLAPPGPGEALIEMRATGLCHSDLGFMEGSAPHPMPAVLGHEGAGVVLQCGPGVDKLKPGDHVITFSAPHCGHCHYCASEHTNWCDDVPMRLAGVGGRFSIDGEPVATFSGLGTFATHAVIAADQLIPIRRDVALDVACTVACAGATGLGAALVSAKVHPGSTVVVFGLGGVGLNTVQGGRIADAGAIVGVDLNPDREAIGRALGLTHFVAPKEGEDVVQSIRALVGAADYAFECAGSAKAFKQAVACTDPVWGKVICVGATEGRLPLSIRDVMAGRQVSGSFLGGVIGRRQIPEFIDWLAQGRVDFASLITERIPLDRINDGFDRMRSGQSIRTVVTF